MALHISGLGNSGDDVMNMTQTLKSFFSKKTKPQAKIENQTDGEAVERSAVLNLSSKVMSRIATFTLFCFLSQTFAQTLYAATDGLSGLRLHISAPINYASLPQFSLFGTFSGEDDNSSHSSNNLSASGTSLSSNQSAPRTPTNSSVPVEQAASQDAQPVEKLLRHSFMGDVAISTIMGQKDHGWDVSTEIIQEENGFKLNIGQHNNLLLSALISFSGLIQVTHAALTDALSLSVKSYAHVHFDKRNDASLGHVTIDAKDMQVTGDWHADSLAQIGGNLIINPGSSLIVQNNADVKAFKLATNNATLKAKKLSVEAHIINNINGILGGSKLAEFTLRRYPIPSFNNKGGTVGSTKKAVFNIEDGQAIRNLGTLQGEEVTIRHTSTGYVLDLTQGVVQASKIVRLYGTHIKGRLSTDIGVQFETPLLWINAKNFDLLPQTAINLTQVYLTGLKNFHLTHDYRTAQHFYLTEHNFITKDKAEDGVKQPRVLKNREFHIDAVVQAKSMEILTPSYTGVVGLEDGENSKRGELLTEEGHLDVVAHDFDLQRGTIAADSADFIVRETLKVGRLIEDQTRKVFATLYGHANSEGSGALSCCFQPKNFTVLGRDFPNFYNGRHLLMMPAVTGNKSAIFVKHKCHINGELIVNGEVRTKILSLKTKKSVVEAGSLVVDDDAEINGPLVLKRHLGKFDALYYWCQKTKSNTGSETYALSNPSRFYVGRKLSGDTSLENIGSIIHVHQTTDTVRLLPNVNITTNRHQKFIECTHEEAMRDYWNAYYPLNLGTVVGKFHELYPKRFGIWDAFIAKYPKNISRPTHYFNDYSNGLNYAVGFLLKTNNFAGAQQVFPAQTSFGESVVLPEATHLSGFISAPTLLVTASPQGLVIGTKNPFYVPPKPAVAMFKFKDLQAVASGNLQMNQIPGIHLSNAFRFYVQERFFHEEDKAQAFYDRVRSDIHIITKDRKIKPYQGQVIKMTPQLMLPWLQKQVQDTLMRGYIEPGEAVDFELLAKLHKNGTEYLRQTGLDQESNNASALVLYDESATTQLISAPDKPMIFYMMDETDPHQSLMPNIYFPKDLRDGARSDRGSLVHANNFMVIPYNMTADQFLRLASYRPEMMALASSAPALIAHLNRDVSAAGSARTMPATTEMYGELRITEALLVIASGNLTVNAKIEAEKAVFASLEGNVTFETAIKRIGHGDNWTDVKASTSDVTMRGMLTILAPNGVATVAGAKLTSTDAELAIMGRHVLLKSVGLASHRSASWHKHYEEENNLRQLQASIKGEKVTVIALETLMTAGVIVESGSLGTTLQGGEVIQQGTHNMRQFSSITHGDSSAFRGGKTVHDNRQTVTAIPDVMQSEGNIKIISLKEPLTVVGTKYILPAGKKVMITTRGGAQFLAAWSQDIHQVANAYKGFAKIQFSGYTEQSKTATPVTVSGGGTMEITMVDEDGNALSDSASAPIRIEMPQGANLDQMKDLSWVTDVLKAHQDVELIQVKNGHDKIEYRVTAMSPQLSMVIALAVAVCTAGAGLAGAVAMTATQAMVGAATTALITQTITATVGYAMGDGKAFAKAVSEDKLKSVGIDIVCAGLTQGITNSINTGNVSTLQAACLRTAVRELKVVALTGKWDARECLGREAASTIEGAAKVLVKSIGDQYSTGDMTFLEHKIQHGLTASIAEAAAGLAESAITGQKSPGLLELSVASGVGAVLVECVAEALYSPQDLLPPEEMSALKKEAIQNAQTKLGANADPQKLAEETIRQFGALYQPHQNNHIENTRKIALLTNIAIGALANNPDILQAMHHAADRALTHNFMVHAPQEAAMVWAEAVRQLNWMQKSAALIMLARAGIQIINVLPCGRALKGARYIYKIGNAVRTFNKIEDAIRFVNADVTTGAAQIVGAAYNDLVAFGDVLEREGLKAAGMHVCDGCTNWIKDNITQGLDIDGTAALDHESFKAYDGGQESVFERKSTKGSSASASTPQQSSGASTGGAMPPPEEDPKDPKKPDGTFKTPDGHKEIFEKTGKRNSSLKNKSDGSIWEKDNSSHGGEQFKRWENKRSWERGEKPNSLWPDGRVRK